MFWARLVCSQSQGRSVESRTRCGWGSRVKELQPWARNRVNPRSWQRKRLASPHPCAFRRNTALDAGTFTLLDNFWLLTSGPKDKSFVPICHCNCNYTTGGKKTILKLSVTLNTGVPSRPAAPVTSTCPETLLHRMCGRADIIWTGPY